MRIVLAVSLGTFLLGAAASATAQQVADPAPFSGLYVGGSVGYDVQRNDVKSRVLFDRNLDGVFGDQVSTAAGANAFSPGFCNGAALGATPGGCRNDKDAISYSGRVGYDRQAGNIVFGGVGEFGKSEIDDSVTAYSTTPASYTLTRKVNWEVTARARAGYAFNTTLFYATGGAGYAKIGRSFTTTNTANAFAERGKRNQFGYVVGGGVDQKLGRHLSFGMEYLYHRYNDDAYRVRATAGTAPATNPFILAPNTTGTDFRRSDKDFGWHSIRGTAAFHF